MVTCYDPNGNPVEKEPIDARECCMYCGFTMEPPEPVAENVASPVIEPIADESEQPALSQPERKPRKNAKTISEKMK